MGDDSDYLYKIFYFFYFDCVCVCVCTRATVSICMSEDNFKEFVLTVGTEDAMQVVRLGGKCP